MEKENIKGEIISHIEVKGLWGKTNISWSPDPHVNILAGINGSGKTTLLNILEEILQGKVIKTRQIFQSALITSNTGGILKCDCEVAPIMSNESDEISVSGINHYNVSKISTFDIDIDRPTDLGTNVLVKGGLLFGQATWLDVELRNILYFNGQRNISFIKLDAINSDKTLKFYEAGKSQEAKELQAQLSSFFDLINSFFARTGKKIEFTVQKDILFKIGDERIQLTKLSAGEKQLLIILFSVYLQQRQPYIMLMDEPEISLHIEWQSKLIDTLLAINPNIQLIIATHSPSIFGKGWGDKFVNILDLTSSNG
jgi:predicted ATP-binding protein involved in virulence